MLSLPSRPSTNNHALTRLDVQVDIVQSQIRRLSICRKSTNSLRVSCSSTLGRLKVERVLSYP